MTSSLSPTTTLTIQDAALGQEIMGRNPRFAEGQYTLQNGGFVRDTQPKLPLGMTVPIKERSNQESRIGVTRNNTASSNASSTPRLRPSLTIDTNNVRRYARLNSQSKVIIGMSACQVETPGSAYPHNDRLQVTSQSTASRSSEETSNLDSPSSSVSGWVLHSLSARTPRSASSFREVNRCIIPTEIETPITTIDAEPLSATLTKLVASDIRLKKIVQAVEERSKLEKRLRELDELITSKQELAQNTSSRNSSTPIEIVSGKRFAR